MKTKKFKKILSLVLSAAMVALAVISMKNATVKAEEAMTEDQILAAIATLEEGKSIAGTQSLTGEITKIKTAYDDNYKNVTVVIKVKDKEIDAFRMKNGSELKVGDKITVTGTIKNYKGTIEFDAGCTYVMVQAAPDNSPTAEPTTLTEAEILTAIATLAAGDSIPGKQSLTGAISSIKTAYDDNYKNITVIIKVQDKEIMAYRMNGGAELKVGDKITVTGTIKNYNGTIEFDAKCTYVMVEAAPENTPSPSPSPEPTPEPATLTEAEILAAIATLEAGKSIPGDQSLTGVITSIKTPYDAGYKNITVVIKVQDKEIEAFRMKDGAELKVGDKIKVTGTIKNYNGTIEFDAKCTYNLIAAAPNTGVASVLPAVAMVMIIALGAAVTTSFLGNKRKNNL